MFTKASLLAAATVGIVKAQSDYWFIPTDLTDAFCDGITRPDWDACDEAYVDWFRSTNMHIGPGVLQGQTMTVEGCQLRYVSCIEGDYEWTMEEEGGMFRILRNSCDGLGAGGVQRQGDLCLIVEDPNNPFAERTRAAAAADVEERAPEPAAKRARSHAKELPVSVMGRDLVSEARALERRQSCSGGGDCYEYTESLFAGNIRGDKVNVCENILPDGDSCTLTKSVTIGDSTDVSWGLTAGFKDALGLSASFTSTRSESVTTTISTTINVNCPGGSGRIVWYPFMEVSRGECIKGTCDNGYCWEDQREFCENKKPISPEEGRISGEYAVECI